ncbi:MAG: insulinase family protein [Spirochaetes bacterium]|nr:insulinase family protein [Spirochaetota bacterium]
MIKKQWIISLAFLLIITLFTMSYRPIYANPLLGIGNVEQYTLPNGITCLLVNRGYAPTLALLISFKVGSVDENYQTAGAAHLLEHMMFKGTKTIGTTNFEEENKLLQQIEAIGETIDRISLTNPDNVQLPVLKERLKILQEKANAYVVNSAYDAIYTQAGGINFNAGTSRDMTQYYIELPNEALELWAKLESERIKEPVFRQFYTERNTVYEERLMRYESDPQNKLFEDFLGLAFLAHPYRHPTIGYKSNIPFLSLSLVRKFYFEHYTPQKMTITVVGKQDTAHTLKILHQYFGTIPQSPSQDFVAINEDTKNSRRLVMYADATPYLLIGWHKPTMPHFDDYVFDIVAEILAGGKSSKLYKKLVIEKKIASQVNAYNGYPGARYNNLFILECTPKDSSLIEDVESMLYKELYELAQNCTQDDITAAVRRLESALIFDIDTNIGIARLLSYYQTITNNWRYILTYSDMLGKVTCNDIQRVISTYCKKEWATVAVLKKM